MAWILPILVLVFFAIIAVLTLFLIDEVVGPIYAEVLGRQAVQDVGFDIGAETALKIGSQYVIPLMLLALSLWFLVLRLQKDEFKGVRRR